MSNYSKMVFDLSENFMKDSKHVWLNEDKIHAFSNTMKNTVPRKFSPPKPPPNQILEVFTQLIAGSINYCYWYGRSDIRPNGCASGKMFSIVEKHVKDSARGFENERNYTKRIINEVIRSLSLSRFPLLEEREKHLKELINNGYAYAVWMEQNGKNIHDYYGVQFMMETLIENFPGYSSDIFLKRASLLFLMLYRRFGWFKDALKSFHVPADYQVPKMLHFFDLISYSDSLQSKIENNILIPKNSLEECEIRAATVLACRELCKLTEWNVADVDGWFWLRRQECNAPFHLTITTDY